jgi:carbon storage regulator
MENPMLVLSRKSNESVMVGGNDRCERTIKVTVLEIEGNRVRLGFEADNDVPVHRFEVWERVNEERKRKDAPDTETLPVAL